MTVLAHISDPHFGTEDPAITRALLDELTGVTAPSPAAILVSGDLTQRAREEQFVAARAFLDRLSAPYVVVPGNHDVPLYDVVSRFLHPLRRYCRHITDELMPRLLEPDFAVVGLTTAHGFTVKDGKVTVAQARAAAAFLADAGERFKIIVAHHPFALPARHGDPDDLVDGVDRALPILEAAGVAAICTGHLHATYASEPGFRTDDRAIVSIHAGTCTSTRRRGEPNGYNRLILDDGHLTIQERHWAADRWIDGPRKAYRRGADRRWRHAPAI